MLGFKKNTPKVFDYSAKKRFWGHNFKLQTKLDDEGYKWEIAIWNEHMPNPGDFILLGLNNSETTTAIIKKVEPCGNPSDMYFIKIDIRNSKNKFESTKEVTGDAVTLESYNYLFEIAEKYRELIENNIDTYWLDKEIYPDLPSAIVYKFRGR